MQSLRPRAKLCNSCSYQLLALFTHGFNNSHRLPQYRCKTTWTNATPRRLLPHTRNFASQQALKAQELHDTPLVTDDVKRLAELEDVARQARQTFGETLPKDFLSQEEYKIYERLYGPPIAVTLPEDVELLQNESGEDLPSSTLMREDEDGNLEEVILSDEKLSAEEESGDDMEAVSDDEADAHDDFEARLGVLRQRALQNLEKRNAELEDLEAENEPAQNEHESDLSERQPEAEVEKEEEQKEQEEDFFDEEDPDDDPFVRTHPVTAAGQYGTSPSTIYLPKDSFVDPITAILRESSNKQLSEVAEKTFGGHGLPNSTATFKRPNLVQQTIALDAYQGRMGEMEANAYFAAIYPAAYSSVMHVLVEVRKRLGSDWLRGLMSKPEGPRILDAGAAGAGILAWRDVIDAESASMNPSNAPFTEPSPYGKSTVVTGSPALRLRASALLENTSFIPRLPDYDPSRDHPALESSNPQPRKQYDIIVAPYTLWPLKEDHQRKSQIQNFWSLLDPKGGVLVLIEKGVPIGFEIIAAARETLLKHHISSPGSESVAQTINDASPNRFGSKESGMIIAPCTTHGKCPMYRIPGRSPGRKDFCHFNQRFIRPPYLQRLLNAKERNHEDVQFSYVAFQRGKDARHEHHFAQNIAATDSAFTGYEHSESAGRDDRTGALLPPDPILSEDGTPSSLPDSFLSPAPHPQTFPRILLRPLKRRGHVTMDVCTPSATLERWTVPKSFSKRAYRDARKSQWGDLWALGAKTRVARNLRLGKGPKDIESPRKRKEKVVDVMRGAAVGADMDDEDDDFASSEESSRRSSSMPDRSKVKGRRDKKARERSRMIKRTNTNNVDGEIRAEKSTARQRTKKKLREEMFEADF